MSTKTLIAGTREIVPMRHGVISDGLVPRVPSGETMPSSSFAKAAVKRSDEGVARSSLVEWEALSSEEEEYRRLKLQIEALLASRRGARLALAKPKRRNPAPRKI